MKVLIIYGSTEGQTRKISHFLKEELMKSGHQVTLADATDKPPLPDGFDLVLIGSSVHMHKYQPAILHYLNKNAAALNKITSGFFSVSMAAAGYDRKSLEELKEMTNAMLEHTGWKPAQVEYVAGALLYTQYDFFKKLVMRLIAKSKGEDTDTSSDHEYTEWSKLKLFLGKMAQA
jgi:menaquinone-dependent protoporphyrinogen oxidase